MIYNNTYYSLWYVWSESSSSEANGCSSFFIFFFFLRSVSPPRCPQNRKGSRSSGGRAGGRAWRQRRPRPSWPCRRRARSGPRARSSAASRSVRSVCFDFICFFFLFFFFLFLWSRVPRDARGRVAPGGHGGATRRPWSGSLPSLAVRARLLRPGLVAARRAGLWEGAATRRLMVLREGRPRPRSFHDDCISIFFFVLRSSAFGLRPSFPFARPSCHLVFTDPNASV